MAQSREVQARHTEVAEQEFFSPNVSFLRHPGSIVINAQRLGQRYRAFYPNVTPDYVTDNLGPLTLYQTNPHDLKDLYAAGNLAVDLTLRTNEKPDIIIAIQSHLPTYDPDPYKQRVALHHRARLANLGLANSTGTPDNSPTFSAACSSFVFALDWLRRRNPQGAHVLMVIDETGYRKTLFPIPQDDQKTGLLMSDFAVALEFTYGENFEVIASETSYDEIHGDLLGMRVAKHHEDDAFMHVYPPPYADFFTMQGSDLRRYFAREIRKAGVQLFLTQAGVDENQIQAFLGHQASIRMVHNNYHLLPDVPYKGEGIKTYGNTSSASIPLDLEDGIKNGTIQKGGIVYLLAFGGGLTWGQALLRF